MWEFYEKDPLYSFSEWESLWNEVDSFDGVKDLHLCNITRMAMHWDDSLVYRFDLFSQKGAHGLWIFVQIFFETGKKMHIQIAKRFRIAPWLNYLFWSRSENTTHTHIPRLDRVRRQCDPYQIKPVDFLKLALEHHIFLHKVSLGLLIFMRSVAESMK